MRVESIRLKNFRAFRDVHMRDIPRFCVLIGANGTGKSTLFSVFSFLRDAMSTNVTEAFARLGGNRGFQEVRSRDSEGPIEIELTLHTDLDADDPITYFLQLAEDGGQPIVERETLVSTRGGRSRHLIDFRRGTGESVINEYEREALGDEVELKTEAQTLKSADLLAIKGLAQFARFPTAGALGSLIEKWHLSDFGTRGPRLEQEAKLFAHDRHLSPEGENLPLVIEYLQDHQPRVFQEILTRLARRIPGITHVESKRTEEGRVLLKFQDGAFEDPFLARNVSDGTIKLLAYLVLLLDPRTHPLLCVEEPENQLYPSLLSDLAEEFRSYAIRGGQVFVSTHSPDFLNAVELNEVFWLVKQDGYTVIRRAKDDEQIATYMADGDKLGYLWNQGLFAGADPA